jgi:hypothetical protein
LHLRPDAPCIWSSGGRGGRRRCGRRRCTPSRASICPRVIDGRGGGRGGPAEQTRSMGSLCQPASRGGGAAASARCGEEEGIGRLRPDDDEPRRRKTQDLWSRCRVDRNPHAATSARRRSSSPPPPWSRDSCPCLALALAEKLRPRNRGRSASGRSEEGGWARRRLEEEAGGSSEAACASPLAGGWAAGDGTEGEEERERGCGWEKKRERLTRGGHDE